MTTSETIAALLGPSLVASGVTLTTVTLPWTAPSFAALKGIIHEPGVRQFPTSAFGSLYATFFRELRGRDKNGFKQQN